MKDRRIEKDYPKNQYDYRREAHKGYTGDVVVRDATFSHENGSGFIRRLRCGDEDGHRLPHSLWSSLSGSLYGILFQETGAFHESPYAGLSSDVKN